MHCILDFFAYPGDPPPITSTSRTFSIPPPSIIPSSSSFVVGCGAQRMRSGTYRSSRGGGGVQVTSCSARHGRDGYGRAQAPASTRVGCGWWVRERKFLAARGTGGSGRSIHTLRLSVPLRLQLQYSTLPPHAALHFFSYSDVLPGLPFVLWPTSHRLHHIDLVPLCFPSPVSRFLDAGSVIPVAPIPAARISIDLRLRSPPRVGIARRGPGWRGRTRLFSWAYIGAGEDDPHASGAGSGIGLHRARRWWWEWEGRLVRRTSRRRLALAREGGYDGARRVCPTSIIVARSSEACAPRARDAVRKGRRPCPCPRGDCEEEKVRAPEDQAIAEGRGGGSAEEEEGWRQEQERRTWKRAYLCIFLARTLSRCPSRPSFHRLATRYRTCSSASLHPVRARHAPSDPDLARRSPTRNRPRVCGAGWRRGKRSARGSGRRRGRAAHVSPDAHPPAHRIGRVEEEREEGARWCMEMGMRKAHMMCVARLPLAPHASPARKGKGIGGEEEVNELKHQRNFPDLPLRQTNRLLILPSGPGSAPSSRRLLIGVNDGVPQSPPDGARASRAASPRLPMCGLYLPMSLFDSVEVLTEQPGLHFEALKLAEIDGINGAWNEPSNLASTSPPDSTGFISTSVSSTNSALTDYEVEVVERSWRSACRRASSTRSSRRVLPPPPPSAPCHNDNSTLFHLESILLVNVIPPPHTFVFAPHIIPSLSLPFPSTISPAYISALATLPPSLSRYTSHHII
ncbi:hypothetical protein B0H14DRAFT_3522787 [Mycena olivaceomarginata]|nr:hypothetical protein B0H14DRAFT_3522787 [Mycena olivaceomarginata]